jgi:hypothetical protein
MKIVYLAKVKSTGGLGINKKIIAQVQAWKSFGLVVELVLVVRGDSVPSEFAVLSPLVVFTNNLLGSFICDKNLERTISITKPDLIYFRMSNLPLITANFLFRYPVVMEINTKIFDELKVSYTGIKRKLLEYHFTHLLEKAVGYVGVTSECLEGLPHRPNVQVGNSIDFSDSVFISSRLERCVSKKIIFVGSEGCPWHGVDRLVDVARELPEYKFFVVGYSKGYLMNNISRALPNNFIACGYLTGSRYDELMKESTIAFGSLALDRNCMKQSSSLKNRDYLQYGLCLIMQGVDSDLEALSCVYSLPVKFETSDVVDLVRQIEQSKDTYNTDDVEEIKKAIGANFVEQRRVLFFSSVLESLTS